MNLILFELGEFDKLLPLNDPRVIHILEVLRRKPGQDFDAGVIDGPQGKAHYREKTGAGLVLVFDPVSPTPDPEPITLLIGHPRPQTARRILREASAIGVGTIHFHLTSRGDPGYARSTLWSSGEYRRHLIAGTEQAFSTRLPGISHGRTLNEVLTGLGDLPTRLALDNYEAEARLVDAPLAGIPAALAVGSERGWTGSERDVLRQAGFRLVDLGSRVLRAETAMVAGLAILRARFGL
ncbi:MAG: 16S rRNA (uracil(1498)-N(3))-methyltransferase [Verrucomicrobia bacterium]|nr:MAG: 16S rRNA (uracil(1498)-N(3))-methyltransferase [Verrucomicrobiota bacterium]